MAGWRTERFEMRKRRSAAQSFMTIKHSAAQNHVKNLLNASGAGVAVLEHPWCINAKGKQFGHDTLWRSNNLFGDGPSYELLISNRYSPLAILDIACATTHEGVLTAGIEIVFAAPINASKRALLRTLSFPVFSVDANDALALTEKSPWIAGGYFFRDLSHNAERIGFPFTHANKPLGSMFAKLMGESYPLGKLRAVVLSRLDRPHYTKFE